MLDSRIGSQLKQPSVSIKGNAGCGKLMAASLSEVCQLKPRSDPGEIIQLDTSTEGGQLFLFKI